MLFLLILFWLKMHASLYVIKSRLFFVWRNVSMTLFCGVWICILQQSADIRLRVHISSYSVLNDKKRDGDNPRRGSYLSWWQTFGVVHRPQAKCLKICPKIPESGSTSLEVVWCASSERSIFHFKDGGLNRQTGNCPAVICTEQQSKT